MIDHRTDINKYCHQTSQISAQAAVVMNLTGQNGRHFLQLAVSVLTMLWMISRGFYVMLDNKILTKRQNEVLHQF